MDQTPNEVEEETKPQLEKDFYIVSQKVKPTTLENDNEMDSIEELRNSGYSDLRGVGSEIHDFKSTFNKKELLSHVPQEMTVVKYGYVDNRVISMLEEIIDTGGFISMNTLNAINIVSIKMEPDGRDINIHYRLKRTAHLGDALQLPDFSIPSRCFESSIM